MKILNRVLEGLTQVFLLGAMLAGAFLVVWILIFSDFWWITKVMLGFGVISAFVNGYTAQRRKDKTQELLDTELQRFNESLDKALRDYDFVDNEAENKRQ